MTSTHSLSADAFIDLADGAGDGVVVSQLREAQLSKHLMLLRVVAEAATRSSAPSPATAAFQAGYKLLARVQSADPAGVARLLGLPHIGSWAHDALARLDQGSTPDFRYLAGVAAAAAIRLGIPFELEVPAPDGRVVFPGLGCLRVPGQDDWIRLSSDGKRLRAGERIELMCAVLLPDDGSRVAIPHWRGTPLIRVEANGRTWDVLLEAADRYLDRYTLPMQTAITTVEIATWRQRLQSAWELLVRHHEWSAGPIAEGVTVIVPLVPRSDLDSATSPAAFGAIATSLPPSPISLAETLVHEFQHIKLCGLMDMLPLIEPSAVRGYAPWREDPRPMGGLLQGAYAFTGIVRFWDAQRHLETGPDDILRASVLYERWRLAIERATGALLASGVLTPVGVRFVTALRERGQCQESTPVSAEAGEIAREVDLDNWLTWQIRHTAVDAEKVAGLAAAYRSGEPSVGQTLPAVWLEDEIRKVGPITRSRLLNMRFQEPRRYRQLFVADMPGLTAADALLVDGDASAAVAAYRTLLADEPDPAGWIGLALAVHRLSATPARSVFASQLPLLLETHACLAGQGIHVDPLALAAWFE